ncbi:MAG: hypothetical protein MUF78_01625 [Candidatus Edwardsbacteria bacterium]|jgi:hypothetical protein|nr:hypothetical protein [Candidatus Edwardsbacteria bacterium]
MIAKGVVILLLLVYAAIDFNDKIQLVAVEIGYESMDYLLATKTIALYGIFANGVPKAPLGIGHVLPEMFCQKKLVIIDVLYPDYS